MKELARPIGEIEPERAVGEFEVAVDGAPGGQLGEPDLEVGGIIVDTVGDGEPPEEEREGDAEGGCDEGPDAGDTGVSGGRLE